MKNRLFSGPTILVTGFVLIMVACGGGSGGSNTTTSGAPAFTTHPVGTTGYTWGPVSFTVVVSGNTPVSYQWRKNSTAIVNATSSTFSIQHLALSDAGQYEVLASNSVGSAVSNSAQLQVLTNQAPSTPVIVGPTTALTLHPAFYNLSATDPDGDAITFTVTGTGFVGSGNSAILNAAAAGTSTITVVAKDSKGANSTAQTLAVQVAANRAPQFLSSPSGDLTGSSSTINWTSFQVHAQDPDTDDVQYSIIGTPSFTDNTGAAVVGATCTINSTTGMINFTGTVPAGKTSVAATFTVQATDKLPGTGTVLGATAAQAVVLTYRKN